MPEGIFDSQSNERIIRAVLWSEDQTGAKPGLRTRQRTPRTHPRLAIADADIAKGSSGAVTPVSGDTASETAISGFPAITAHARYQDVSQDDQLLIMFVDGGWEIIMVECEDNTIASLTTSTTGGTGSTSAMALPVYNSNDAATYQVAVSDLFGVSVDNVLLDPDDNIMTDPLGNILTS